MIWRDQSSTAVFYKTIASLRSSIQEDVRRTSNAHRLIRTLRDQKKLVRCYTQNIDGLEEREGLSTNLERGKGSRARFMKKVMQKPQATAGREALDRGCEVVQLHGDLQSLRCTLCQQCIPWSLVGHSARFLTGRAPVCPSCTTTSELREFSGKRGTKIGTLRPNVVLYGEEHPSADAVGEITTHDLSLSPDLLLVMGTSLHVHGLKTMVREFAKAVHSRPKNRGKVIFINLSRPAESTWKDVFDFWVAMDCDRWVDATRKCRPDIWQMQAQLSGKVTKPKAAAKIVKKKQYEPGEDKENAIPDSEDSEISLLSSPPPKVVIMTPKSKNVPFVNISSRSHGSARRLFKTSRVIPDSDPTSSLPTPPSSGSGTPSSHRKRTRVPTDFENEVVMTPSKRKRLLESPGIAEHTSPRRKQALTRVENIRLATPSKRRKLVQIWEDV